MATNTPNYNFDLREGTDIFNPLSSNANWESLDTLLKTIQETGGITTYTTTASASLLKLSGTPKVNDTVFKFVAAGDANTWTAATGGVINNIVALDGKQVTIKGGNMYVAWINSANAMVVVAWPAVVDAQTFDGKGPAEWATKVQLDAVNQTAANATQTAQAAATVANNAVEQVATKLGFSKLWTNNAPGNDFAGQTVEVANIKNYKAVLITFKTGGDASNMKDSIMIDPSDEYGKYSFQTFGFAGLSAGYRMMFRRIDSIGANSITFGEAYYANAYGSGAQTTQANFTCIPLAIYGL